jgi:hypothetical protein
MRRQRSESFGEHGAKVRLFTRGPRRRCWLRWEDASKPGGRAYKNLGHSDWEAGRGQARRVALELAAMLGAEARGVLTVGGLFARYEAAKTPEKTPAQQKEDLRRIALWTAFLGATRNVETIDPATMDDFKRKRAAGEIVFTKAVPRPDGQLRQVQRLKTRPTPRTVGADIAFLYTVLEWAELQRESAGRPLLDRNPIRGYTRPDTPNPRRPVATYDRFLKLREHADKVDPQGLFGSFLELVEALGWRVSAICRLWASDVDLAPTKAAPHGRIRKREENDKERVEMWVPLSAGARTALERVLSSRQVVGDVWLFPAPRRPGQPWTRHHAKDLLNRATTAAKLEPLAGGDFHPFRRKWVTERKHLPLADVAAAGGWKTVQTLEQSYARADSETMLAVVTEARKLREVK